MASRTQILIPITIAAAIIGVVGILTIPSDSKLANVEFRTGTVKLDSTILNVQIAETDAQRTRGLMFQNQFPYDQGMIFVFKQPQVVPIWMLNMQFPLDIIWFNSTGNVVYIEKNAPPCKTPLETASCAVYNADLNKAAYVLEVTSGFVDKFNITQNSTLKIISL